MRAGGGREKGNSFERRVAKMVVLAFECFGINKEDCYRTPSSGGHRYAKKEDPGDLVVSRKLRKLFPYHVECKHYRRVELYPLFIPEKRWKRAWKFPGWIRQAKAASLKKKQLPIVVFKGNGTQPIMVLFPTNTFMEGFMPVRVLKFRFEGDVWFAATFKSFLLKLVEKENADNN